MAPRERIAAVGSDLLRHLATIAGGHPPGRPAAGVAGGDPWPDPSVRSPTVRRIPGTRLRLIDNGVAA
jgi:hypothetical protein